MPFSGGVTADEHDRGQVLTFVLQYFPSQFEFITRQLDAFRTHSLRIGVAGTLALVWGALGFFGAITTAVNYAWGVEKQRSYWKHKLFSFLMLLVAGSILLIALALVSASQMVGASWFAGVLTGFPGLGILRSLALRNATRCCSSSSSASCTTSCRTRRCGSATSGSAPWSRDSCGRARSRRSPGTFAT